MKTKDFITNSYMYLFSFIKWLAISIIVGALGGVVGSFFHKSIDYATNLRLSHPYIILFLPLGGLIIALLYKIFSKRGKIDTDRVIESIREDSDVPIVMVPLIFISTVITHFFGGSAGREGAALQLGGSIGYNVGRIFRLKKSDSHIIVMAGMSAVFAALFKTPLTAAIFSLEVTSVGIFHYVGLLPCFVSALTANCIASLFGVEAFAFSNIAFGEFSAFLGLRVIILAALCALLSIVFCFCLKKTEHVMEKFIRNPFLRIFTGGIIIAALTIIFKTTDYNGAGMDIISNAISGTAKHEAPILKILFTAITIAAGFKGGEIVPTFFIGSTFGCIIGPILGIDPSVAAAIGFVSLFCAMVNCPIASIFLSIEIFGTDGLILFAVASAVSYILSGCFGLYKSQKIVYSKTDDTLI